MQQDFQYQDQSKEIMYNNPMNKSINLYNQYHSPLSVMSKEELNPQVLSNKEKRNEIELNILLKKSESNSSIENMKINIIKLFEKQSRLIIQITNQNDPLFLYTLELSEIEYQQLKTEQSLLVDFQNFPDFILKMFYYCKNDKEDKYICVFKMGGLNDNNFNSNTLGVLSIEEKTPYRKLNHLTLKLQAANDTTLKKYLSDLSKEYKEKYEILLQKFNDLNQNFDNFQKETSALKEKYQKMEYEHKTSMDNLLKRK